MERVGVLFFSETNIFIHIKCRNKDFSVTNQVNYFADQMVCSQERLMYHTSTSTGSYKRDDHLAIGELKRITLQRQFYIQSSESDNFSPMYQKHFFTTI